MDESWMMCGGTDREREECEPGGTRCESPDATRHFEAMRVRCRHDLTAEQWVLVAWSTDKCWWSPGEELRELDLVKNFLWDQRTLTCDCSKRMPKLHCQVRDRFPFLAQLKQSIFTRFWVWQLIDKHINLLKFKKNSFCFRHEKIVKR